MASNEARRRIAEGRKVVEEAASLTRERCCRREREQEEAVAVRVAMTFLEAEEAVAQACDCLDRSLALAMEEVGGAFRISGSSSAEVAMWAAEHAGRTIASAEKVVGLSDDADDLKRAVGIAEEAAKVAYALGAAG